MKFSKLAIALFATFAAATSTANAYASVDSTVDFNQWSKSDLQQFLADFQVEYKDSDTQDTLINQVKAHWNSFAKPYQSWTVDELEAYLSRKQVQYKVDTTAADLRDQLVNLVGMFYPSSNYFSFQSASESGKSAAAAASSSVSSAYDKVSNWVFDTWSTSQLAAFVQSAKDSSIETVATTRKELQKQAQDIYDRSVTAHANFGQNYYPGKWIFENWSDQSLRAWLDQNRINLQAYGEDAKQQTINALDHEKLIAAVRKNSRNVYDGLQDSRNSFLDQLQILNNNIYDKTGTIKNSIFQTWSDAQLSAWLASHKLIDSVSDAVPSKDEMVKLAKENTNLLQQDINRYLAAAQKHTSPILSKLNDAGNNLVDYTYGLWDASRMEKLVAQLKQDVPGWLENRVGEASSMAADAASAAAGSAEYTKDQASAYLSHIFDAWSTTDLQAWLAAQGQAVNSAAADTANSAAQERDRLVKLASEHLHSANTLLQQPFDDFVQSFATTWRTVSATAFAAWPDTDLQAWIAQHAPASHKLYFNTNNHDDLVKTARQVFANIQHGGTGAAQQAASQASAHAKAAAGAAAGAGANIYVYAEAVAGAGAEVVAEAVASAGAGAEAVGEAVAKAGSAASAAAEARAGTFTKSRTGNSAVKYLKQGAGNAWSWASDRFSRGVPGNTDL